MQATEQQIQEALTEGEQQEYQDFRLKLAEATASLKYVQGQVQIHEQLLELRQLDKPADRADPGPWYKEVRRLKGEIDSNISQGEHFKVVIKGLEEAVYSFNVRGKFKLEKEAQDSKNVKELATALGNELIRQGYLMPLEK